MSKMVDTRKRRTLMSLLGAAGMTGLGGGAGMLARAVDGATPVDSRHAFLAPPAFRLVAALPQCIDVHAHFFNASDVTVEGYLEGPVAHAFGDLGWLVKKLAKLADGLGAIAISAREELDQLPLVEAKLRTVADEDVQKELRNLLKTERERISKAFDELTRASRAGEDFREGYRRAIRGEMATRGTFAPVAVRDIDALSVSDAMFAGEWLGSPVAVARAGADDGFYAERLLGFIGYMLSSRWTNLLSYREAMTTSSHSIGVTRVLGALVNFDRWLDGKPRSKHEDQLELHAQLSKRSAGYMQPIMSYNPWTDIAEQGSSLALVEKACAAGFVGVKIYPANGFRPYGNAALPNRPGRPSGADLDATLQRFWLKCLELDLPVMSHAAARMGKDDAHDVLGAPPGWKLLLDAGFWPANAAPRLNLGHFGGDSDHERNAAGKNWPKSYAALMTHARGRNVFADLGYWNDLTCAKPNKKPCTVAKPRFAAALAESGRIAADRVMFGTDWLMLSREKKWSEYPGRLLNTIRGIAPNDVDKIFALNARRCFPRVK